MKFRHVAEPAKHDHVGGFILCFCDREGGHFIEAAINLRDRFRYILRNRGAARLPIVQRSSAHAHKSGKLLDRQSKSFPQGFEFGAGQLPAILADVTAVDDNPVPERRSPPEPE